MFRNIVYIRIYSIGVYKTIFLKTISFKSYKKKNLDQSSNMKWEYIYIHFFYTRILTIFSNKGISTNNGIIVARNI